MGEGRRPATGLSQVPPQPLTSVGRSGQQSEKSKGKHHQVDNKQREGHPSGNNTDIWRELPKLNTTAELVSFADKDTAAQFVLSCLLQTIACLRDKGATLKQEYAFLNVQVQAMIRKQPTSTEGESGLHKI